MRRPGPVSVTAASAGVWLSAEVSYIHAAL